VDTGQDYGRQVYDLGFEVCMAMQISVLVFRVITLCGHVGGYQGTSALKMKIICFSEMLVSAC
jgi:hypothetical protein